ncbi:MAG TPA: hypothetical protein VF668_01960 [Pyrinomonadaceae bacterium]
MLWEELLIDREPADDALASALAELFGVGRGDVLVVRDVAAREVPAGVRVLGERGAAGGDFPARLSIYVLDAGLEATDRAAFVGRFCRRLGCSCLVSDDSPNPYSMTRVGPEGARARVYLDVERLDERDEYVVTRPAEEEGGAET